MIMRAIGRGGMGAVYQARDVKRQTICAIKEMSLSTVPVNERPQAIQNFLAEARILSRLKHPNLPAFTDFFTEGARYFLVMEYIDGNTLEDLLEDNGGPFSERRVLGWARQLCDVLEYLHSQQPPVIFRDMKPGNIMLMRNGRIKLIDFGIARLFRASGSHDTQLLGTPGFAPPEQYGTAQTDERSDIYSLAMTLFQLMTNMMPDKGFGLPDIRSINPHISPQVARALQKATALKPEDRYDNIAVFRRALLGVGTFIFENGSEATTPEELAELCARYPEEAADYLLAGEIESWLSEIGANDLARAAKRIRATVGDPEMSVEKFLQVVMGPSAHTRTYTVISPGGKTAGTAGGSNTGSSSRGSMAGSITGRPPKVIVSPRGIDFGQVYPGLSAPMLLNISGEKGALVSGTISTTESWIIIDPTSFDAMSTPVRVRVDSTRLRGSTHYSGTILITPDESEQEIAVRVQLDVLGYTTTSTISRSGQGGPLEEDEEEAATIISSLPGAVVGRTMGSQRMASQTGHNASTIGSAAGSTIHPTPTGDVYTSAKDSEFKAKYGQPGSGGWEPLQTSPRQRIWLRYAFTFCAAFMAASFSYLLLAQLPFLGGSSVLSSKPWFIGVLLGTVPLATLGAVLINWSDAWHKRQLINRLCTGATVALGVLGIFELIWQSLSFPQNPPLQLFVMLTATAAAVTAGTDARVSDTMLNGVTWAMGHMRWLVIGVAILVGAGLGFALANGFAAGCLTPFGILLGIGVAVALVLRVDRLIKSKSKSNFP